MAIRTMKTRSTLCPFLSILLLLAGLPPLVTPLRADNPPTFLFQWGGLGTNNAQFNNPFGGVAIDSSTNVYVADSGNSRIEKFDRNGNYLTQWGSFGTGNGQFEGPVGIAVDGNNNVYVADFDLNRVEKFDSNGNYLTQWGSIGNGNGQFSGANGIAVDGSNNVYVTELFNERVQKFDRNGNYLTQWGSSGSGNGQFANPEGIAVDSSNNVYVADGGNNRIEKFTSNGNFLTQWGSSGSGNGQFNVPFGIAVDSSNNVYVADFDNSRIEKFDDNENYLTQWGGFDIGNALWIALDGSGNFIYVAGLGNDLVQVFANNTAQLPPYITSQSASQNVVAGTNVSFSVTAVGGEPLTYQWTSNTVALFNATNSTFTLANVTSSDSATYVLTVTNSFGNATSSNIVLTIVPAFVNTLAATGISAAGAVLNGSATVGSDEAIVWFNWGTNTNYGNVTATTIVPGGSGTTNLSATLNGLSTSVYHYQIVATNISGVVFGNDRSFVVADSAPTVTTLSPVIATNGVTLDGMVNPNGLDTTVYFKWGVAGGSLSNSTPPTDAGAGAVSLNVSSFITSLSPAEQYDYQVVGSNHLGTVFGAMVAFYPPPFVTVPNRQWYSVASSADGSVLVAVARAPSVAGSGPILISTNSGATWAIATGAPTNGFWETVACSADGSKMIAAGGEPFFPIYTSSDMGVTWVSNNAPVFDWQSVASSADGTRLVAAAYMNQLIYTSTNSGAVWTQATKAPKTTWSSVVLSSDGTKLAAVANGSTNIFTSPDFGTTWITNNVPAGAPQGIQSSWSSIASSADGSKLVAASGVNGNHGFIFISTNSGAAWTVTATNIFLGLTARPWVSVASSADGSKLAAVSDEAAAPYGVVITSTNSGATWTTNTVPFLEWSAVALSADGAKLVATVGAPSVGSIIYVSQTTPAPVLNLSASDNVISWIIPSLDFTLQQSPDLMNWTDVTNQPVLNLTNLQNQVVLPPSDGNSFFRLVH
jgi:DNA-binding beta-propeller fold protein YncE